MGNILTANKKKFLVKRGFKDTYLYKNIILSIYPGENTKTYKYYNDLINKALLKAGVDDIFNIKILCTLGALLMIFLITKSNVYYKTNELIEDMGSKSAMLFAADSGEELSKEETIKKKKEERKLFEYLRERFSEEDVKANEAKAVADIARDMQMSGFNVTDEELGDLARRMQKKLVDYYSLQQTDYVLMLIIGAFAFFVPEIYMYIRSYLIKYLTYNEYLQLEVTAIMVGKLEPIKVEEILNIMSENSKYFKRYIDEIRYNYFDVKNGHGKAFESVIEKISSKELRYLMKALQQAAETDLKITIENLENQRNSNKEFRNIREQNKLKQKDLIGIIIILIALAAVCAYAFAPFQNMMNNFSL